LTIIIRGRIIRIRTIMAKPPEKSFLLDNLPSGEALRGGGSLLLAGAGETEIAAIGAYNALMGTASALLAHSGAFMLKHGITQARSRMLFRIHAAGDDGIHPSELADTLGVGRATVTSLLDGMERDGLVRREFSERDRRSLTAHLTPKGKKLLSGIAPRRRGYMVNVMGALSARECALLLKLNGKIEKRLSEMH